MPDFIKLISLKVNRGPDPKKHHVLVQAEVHFNSMACNQLELWYPIQDGFHVMSLMCFVDNNRVPEFYLKRSLIKTINKFLGELGKELL